MRACLAYFIVLNPCRKTGKTDMEFNMTRIAAAVVLAMFSAVALAGSETQPAPKPSLVPVQWELDFQFQQPKAIRVQIPGEASPRVFWYMVYTVANHTGADQIFVPEFVLYTDTGEIYRAGKGVQGAVFDAVKKTVNDPLLRDTIGVAGRLLQGDDNAKTGVAIWPDFDPKAGAFDVFVGGLSGETAEVVLPVPVEVEQRDAKGNVKMVTRDKAVLTKTLQLHYSLPGEASARLTTNPSLVGKDWVMR